MELTINDIAKLANVSKTTVSRFLNGKYEFMSSDTRKRIQEIIDSTGYTPSNLARSLKTRKGKIIGLTIADMQNQFSSFIFKGISEVCCKKGYHVLVTEVNGDEKDAINSLLSYNIDGLIINTIGGNDEYIIDLAKKKNIPIVLADRSIDSKNTIDTVTCDNYIASYNLMKYLKKQGFENVAFFTSNMKNNSVKNLRYSAFCDAMSDIFKRNPKDTTYIDNFNLKDFIQKYRNSNTAIFCVNGSILLKVLDEVNNLNLSLKEENIGICSFDDWGWQELLNITTIRQDSYECGKICANLLFKRLENMNKTVEFIELPTKLIVRNSTKNEV
ncbi:LacI family DNA-binding transcriptional regulator [Sneathia vaginalis]|uniref:LacI family DNA-binding transcriptional regulator n=1 Tax=Sneathia vaginalis TaxID=187101 RepID=UPI0035C6C62D